MGKGILGPSIVTCCLAGTGCFHLYISWRGSKYNDANLSVSELLEKNHFQVVSSDDNTTWDTIVEEYKKTTIKDAERFSPVKEGDEKQKIKEQLIKDCQGVVNEPTKSLGTYNKSIRWCVKPQTASARLGLKGKIALDISKDEDKKELAIIAYSYQQSKGKVAGFDFGEKAEVEDLAKAMQKGCEPLKDVNNWDKDYETKANRYETLCATKKIAN